MTEKSGFPRYDHPILAWEYDQRQPAPSPGELEWHLKYAALSGGQVLELACGSGRLLIPMAEAGYQIDGVDRSDTMLNRLRAKLTTHDEKIRQRIRLYCVEMTEFVPDRKYALVILAYNSLQYLEKIENIKFCFQHIASLLQPGGHFLFTVRRLSLSDYPNGKRITYDSWDNPAINEENKLSVGSRFISQIDLLERRIINEQIYRICYDSGETEYITQISYAPIIEIPEYISILAESGFNAVVYGGYDERPEDGKSREMCFVCEKR
jgi:SAM-dependent methyltransferase